MMTVAYRSTMFLCLITLLRDTRASWAGYKLVIVAAKARPLQHSTVTQGSYSTTAA
jgi:hypothetical protein